MLWIGSVTLEPSLQLVVTTFALTGAPADQLRWAQALPAARATNLRAVQVNLQINSAKLEFYLRLVLTNLRVVELFLRINRVVLEVYLQLLVTNFRAAWSCLRSYSAKLVTYLRLVVINRRAVRFSSGLTP